MDLTLTLCQLVFSFCKSTTESKLSLITKFWNAKRLVFNDISIIHLLQYGNKYDADEIY